MSEHKFNTGDRVRWVPTYANGYAGHQDCENGEVVGASNDDQMTYVRFDGDPTPKSCYTQTLIHEPARVVIMPPGADATAFDAARKLAPYAEVRSWEQQQAFEAGRMQRHIDPPRRRGRPRKSDAPPDKPTERGPAWQTRMITARMSHQHADTLLAQAMARNVSINTHILQTLGLEVPISELGNPRGRKPNRKALDVEPPIDAAFVMGLLPPNVSESYGRHIGEWGTIEVSSMLAGLLVTANGKPVRWHSMQRSEFRRLVWALGIEPAQPEERPSP